MQIKLAIWMNMPSHHQKDFFACIEQDPDIDLKVIYYDAVGKDRKNLGWDLIEIKPKYESYACGSDIAAIKESIDEFDNRIHIIPGNRSPFLQNLLEHLIENNIRWAHWSERAGFNLAKLLMYNQFLFNSIKPIYLRLSGYKKYAKLVNNFGLGAFSQGDLTKKDYINWGINPVKIENLYYNQELCPERVVDNVEAKSEKMFIYVGTIEKRKGYDILLKALKFVKLNGWILLIVGEDRTSGDFNNLVRKLNIESSIRYVGVVPSSKVRDYINSSDVLIFPTRFDGWGMVVNEAVSLGKAVISSEFAGASYHLIENGKNGFVLQKLSPTTLAAAMSKYISNQDLLEDHKIHSLRVAREYTPKANVNRLKDTLNHWLSRY